MKAPVQDFIKHAGILKCPKTSNTKQAVPKFKDVQDSQKIENVKETENAKIQRKNISLFKNCKRSKICHT